MIYPVRTYGESTLNLRDILDIDKKTMLMKELSDLIIEGRRGPINRQSLLRIQEEIDEVLFEQ